jgi:hypothetical protein
MSDLPTNHILNFDHIADVMYEEMLAAAPQTMFPYKACADYVFMAFDDLVVNKLAGKPIGAGGTRLSIINTTITGTAIDAGTLSVIEGIAGNVDLLVYREIDRCIPFPTWGYIFVVRLGTSVRLEITGDRRLDEWEVLTQGGTLSLDDIMEGFTKALKERAAGIVDGGIPVDMDEFVSAIIRESRQ